MIIVLMILSGILLAQVKVKLFSTALLIYIMHYVMIYMLKAVTLKKNKNIFT